MCSEAINIIDMRYKNGQPWAILGAIGEGADIIGEDDASKIIALSDKDVVLYSRDGGRVFLEVDALTMTCGGKHGESLPDWAIDELRQMTARAERRE